MDFDAFLEHHGVKGMKWGERKANRQASTGKLVVSKPGARNDVTVTQRKARGLTTTGGKHASASLDAQRAAAGKQYIKKSGVHSLSNKELKEVIERMNLEQQYVRLNTPQKKQGKSFLDAAIKDGPKMAQSINELIGQR